jgi:hypothetical protein
VPCLPIAPVRYLRPVIKNNSVRELANSAARWYIFGPKMPIFESFERLWMENVGVLRGHLVFLLLF